MLAALSPHCGNRGEVGKIEIIYSNLCMILSFVRSHLQSRLQATSCSTVAIHIYIECMLCCAPTCFYLCSTKHSRAEMNILSEPLKLFQIFNHLETNITFVRSNLSYAHVCVYVAYVGGVGTALGFE